MLGEEKRSQRRWSRPTTGSAQLVRLLTFFDPDDNALMLYQDLQGGGVI